MATSGITGRVLGLIPSHQHRTSAIVRLAEHRGDRVGHGARHRTGVDAARLHRRRGHDDRADLAVFVGTQTQDEERGLRGDRDGDLLDERETVRGLPVLVPQQPVARRFEHFPFVVVEHTPHRELALDDFHPAVRQSTPVMQHSVQSSTHAQRDASSSKGSPRPLADT